MSQDKETNNLLCFKVICDFVKDLYQVYDKNHPLALYNRLLEKTPISHTKIISKHVSLFENFINTNRDAILEKDVTKFVSDKIAYNDTVLIQVKRFISEADKPTKEQIFKHLQYIASLCTEDSFTFKKALRTTSTTGSSGEGSSKETEFLDNLISKVENTIDVEKIDNPMTAVTQLLSSGVLTDVIGSLQTGLSNGNLDIGKLLGSMQGMAGAKSGKEMPMPDLSSIMNMVPALMGAMGGMGGMGGMPGMMPDSSTPSINELSDEKK